MQLKPGLRLRSQVCETEVVVIKGTGEAALACGGAPVVALGDPVDADAVLSPDLSGGTLLGKRYTDEDDSVEILCAKAGAGTLTLEGRPLAVKAAKALPASD